MSHCCKPDSNHSCSLLAISSGMVSLLIQFCKNSWNCVKSEVAANRVMASVTRWLKEKLRVEVNATKTKVAKPNEIKYLGFGFYQHRENKTWKPKPHIKSVKELKKKLHDETIRSVSTSIKYKISRLNPIIRGWINYFRIGSMKVAMRELDGYLRFRLRMCIWKQWKKQKKNGKKDNNRNKNRKDTVGNWL